MAALVGIALLVIQFAILQRVCPLCLLADVSALGMGVTAVSRRPESPRLSTVQIAIWIIALFAASCAPALVVLANINEPPPDQVREHWVEGQITIVEVTDFDCPHCQKADIVMKEVLPRHKVRLVRLVSPMPGHENAWPAARAYMAAKRQGKGDQMADALLAAQSRAPKECRKMAADLGLDLVKFDRDLDDPAAAVEIRATMEWAKSIGDGLPMIWVQDQYLPPGTPSAKDLEAAIRKAEAAPH